MPNVGFVLKTPRSRVSCSTDSASWVPQLSYYIDEQADTEKDTYFSLSN